VLGRDLYIAVREGARDLGGPGLEFLAVRVGLDARDHEISQVAELVRDDVDESF